MENGRIGRLFLYPSILSVAKKRGRGSLNTSFAHRGKVTYDGGLMYYSDRAAVWMYLDYIVRVNESEGDYLTDIFVYVFSLVDIGFIELYI